MQKVLVTCPFTGLPFEAIEYADGRIVATNKLTGEDIQMTYNASNNRYMVKSSAFKHIPLVTMEECAETLGISKARVSVLMKQDRLTYVKPDAQVYITRDSMLDYKRHQRTLAKAGKQDGARTD